MKHRRRRASAEPTEVQGSPAAQRHLWRSAPVKGCIGRRRQLGAVAVWKSHNRHKVDSAGRGAGARAAGAGLRAELGRDGGHRRTFCGPERRLLPSAQQSLDTGDARRHRFVQNRSDLHTYLQQVFRRNVPVGRHLRGRRKTRTKGFGEAHFQHPNTGTSPSARPNRVLQRKKKWFGGIFCTFRRVMLAARSGCFCSSKE